MTKEELLALGLTEDQIIEVFKINGKDIEKAKGDLATVQTELTSTKEQLNTANAEIESYKSMDIEGIKASAESYKAKFEESEKNSKAEIESLKFEHSLESALAKAGAKNIKATKALLNIEELKSSKNVDTDIEVAITTLKESDAYMFGETDPMRLAGAGSQIGLTEAQIMSFAGALSSVGIEAEAGGSAFSKVMIDMQLAVETNSERLQEFASVAGMSGEEFKKAFQDDAAGAIITFIQGLGNAEQRGLSAIKVLDDMEIKETRLRDALLRASGASDVFTNSLEIGSNAWKENTALTKEAEQRYKTTESQIAIAKNTLKDAGITVGEIVVPHLVSMSEAVKKGAEWFSELNPETQETIVKMAGLAAAVGPVLVVGGKMASGLGSIIGLTKTLSGGIGNLVFAFQAVKGGAATFTEGLQFLGVGTNVATKAVGALSGATGLGSVVTTGTKAGGVIASLGGAAGTGGVLGGLTTGLGAGVAAMAPWIIGIGAVAAGGYALYKSLNQEVIPEIDLFADKIEYTASAIDEFSHGVGTSMEYAVTKISEGTKKAVGAYLELDEAVKFHTDNIYINSTTVTQDMVNEISGQYKTMADSIISATEERAAQELSIMQGFFANNITLTKREQQELLDQHNSYYDNKKAVTERYEEEINAIWQRAAEENRRVTIEEFEQIERLRQGMKEQAIKIMSEQEIEAKIILERMKEYSGRVTAEQASEHIKELNRARDEAVAAAEEEYERTVSLWIRKRDEIGEISEEQAEKLIKDAQRQRDSIAEAAESTRINAIEKMREMNLDLENQVETTTGKILTWWDKLKRWWSGWQPETKAFNVSFSALYDSNQEERVDYLKNAYKARADAYRNSLNQMVEDTKSTTESIENTVSTATTNAVGNVAKSGGGIAKSVQDTAKSVHDTVAENLNQISTKVKDSIGIIEKEFDLWVIKNKAATDSSAYLEKQLELQKQKHELLNEQILATEEALFKIIANYGEGSNEALNYKNVLLDLQLQQEKLKVSIDETTRSMINQISYTKEIHSGMMSNYYKDAAATFNENTKVKYKSDVGDSTNVMYTSTPWGMVKVNKDADKLRDIYDTVDKIHKDYGHLVDYNKGTISDGKNKLTRLDEVLNSLSEKERKAIGKNAHGTNFWTGGWTWVGEQGPEIVELPEGSKVHSNQKSMELMRGKGGDIYQEIHIHSPIPLNPSEIARKNLQASRQLAMEWGN